MRCLGLIKIPSDLGRCESPVSTWMLGEHDWSRTIALMHGFSAKVPRRVTWTDEWPDDFRKVRIVTLTLTSRVMDGWIFNVSGLAIMSVGKTGSRITGRHRRTGQLVFYIFMCVCLAWEIHSGEILYFGAIHILVSNLQTKSHPRVRLGYVSGFRFNCARSSLNYICLLPAVINALRLAAVIPCQR